MDKKIWTIFLFIFLLFPNNSEAGFGVSPAKVIEENLVPGSHYESTVYLVQGDPRENLEVLVSVESDRIKDWVTIEGGSEQTIPAGIQQFPVKLLIDVPQDADLNVYKAFVRVSTVPDKGKTDGNVVIAIGGRIDLEFVVGDNIVQEYDIVSLDILDIKQNRDPTVKVKIRNTGNVSAAPSAASFELFNKFGTVRLGYAEFDDFELVKSFSEDTQEATFPVDIRFAPGEYWGEVKIYNGEGAVIKELRTVFDVIEVGPLDLALVYMLDYWWLGAVAILIIFIFIFLKIKKRKRRRRAPVND